MFEKATRQKLRFDTQRGLVTVEDLWDLPLTGNVSLNQIAIDLNRELKEAVETTSFVTPAEPADTELQLKFEIVKHVIATRIKERDEAKNSRATEAQRQKILEIIAQKKDAELQNLPIEKLTEMAGAL